MSLTWTEDILPGPTGNAGRFGGRWRLVGAGLSNVWRYGDLDLPAVSGRLLLRGPNGTGKTTALEVFWPYLLDLQQQLLSAGKARTTNLSALMREGADGRRRIGYAWLSWAAPGEGAITTYGVRLQFAEGGTPPVRVYPFTAAGRPLHELALWGPGRAALSVEQFAAAVEATGGTLFDDEDHYVRDLATRIFGSDPREVAQLAARIRFVRNPALLGEVSAVKAAEALREALPGVAEDVIEATGEALAESNTTREAFERDRAAAVAVEGFARVWAGHATDVVKDLHRSAVEAVAETQRAVSERDRLHRQHSQATTDAETADQAWHALESEQNDARSRLRAIETSREYQGGEQLAAMARQVAALEATAAADWSNLSNLAGRAARQAREDVGHLQDLSDDLGQLVSDDSRWDPDLAGTVLLSWDEQARPRIAVGERSVDPGPAVTANGPLESLDAAVARLTALASAKKEEGARAKLYIGARRAVDEAIVEAASARDEARRLAATADAADETAKARAADAAAAATAVSGLIAGWRAGTAEDPGWAAEDATDIDWDEPAAGLAGADRLAAITADWAHRRAAGARNRAEDLRTRAAQNREQADELRSEALRIRDNDILLPLPRPEWAGPGDDQMALGAAVEWNDGIDETTQDTVEATLAATGLLGAVLDRTGASTDAWTVRVDRPEADANLTMLLRADPDHPLADVAGAVLARVALADRADDDTDAGLAIGWDGTFRSGVLAAAVPAARAAELRQPASHIGARRRRQAALEHAARLEQTAAGLQDEAVRLDIEAGQQDLEADRVEERLAAFPSREPLRDAEAARVAAARAARDAGVVAAAVETSAAAKEEAAAEEQRRWVADVTVAGLPADVAALKDVAGASDDAARQLEQHSNQLGTRLRRRLETLVGAVAAHDSSAELDGLADVARNSRRSADGARAEHDELSAQVGSTARQAQERHRQVQTRLGELGRLIDAAERNARKAGETVAGLQVRLELALNKAAQAGPVGAKAVAELRAVLDLPGVAEAVIEADPEPDNDRLLRQVGDVVAGRATSARKSVRERAETVKAEVAGTWTLDPGPDHPELLTYLLGYGPASFTPLGAAAHARDRAAQAEASLRAADEAALRDFVVGRLPSAIAQAWTHLHDWTREVNNKMKSASASSGVGVAVKVTVRDDLPPATRTVYELACKTGDALRNTDAKAAAGAAIGQLIDAADGDDMVTRVRNGVDVRAWVDVTYQVTRRGEEPRNWGSRTGLSGGERRLVVLAPMLAAIAALYDRYPATAARLAALDEVPSEVDAEGREGLARYIAQLDLDLIATSHHWDGAPGAWDGIDAHDLEAAPDGTVVAFPMVARGTDLLAGDPSYDLPSL